MNTIANKHVAHRRHFGPVVEFVVERLVLGSLAALIVYGGYRLFML